MSGGSWDYLYLKVGYAASRLCDERDPRRRAFGALLTKIATALHDIEWVDSCDKGKGDEYPAIDAVVSPREVLGEVVEQAVAVRKELDAALERFTQSIVPRSGGGEGAAR